MRKGLLRQSLLCALLAGVFPSLAVAAPPIEALQRSVQQRWGPTSEGARTTFPKRSGDNADPGPYPADGFYGNDLDDPTKLNVLLEDLEGKVFDSLAAGYVTFNEGSFVGTKTGIGYASGGGNYTFAAPIETTVAAICKRPAAPANLMPSSERVALLKTALKRCTVAVHNQFFPYDHRLKKSASGSTFPNNTGCGSANPAAISAWYGTDFSEGDNNMYQGQCAEAFSENIPQGGGSGFPLYNKTNFSSIATRSHRNVGDAPGSVIFCGVLTGTSTHADPFCPIPVNDSWQVVDRKSAQSLTISNWIGHSRDHREPPPSMSCSTDRWTIYVMGSLLVGALQDDWDDDDCSSCAGDDVRCATPGLDSLSFRLGLGRSDYGRKRDELRLSASALTRGFCSPGSVKIQAGPDGLLAKDSTNGLPVQFSNASCILNFVVGSESSFEIREFPRSAVTGSAVDGVYPVSGNPTRRVVIENLPSAANPSVPDWNRVRITVWSGSTAVQTNAWTYTPATGSWAFDRENGQAREVLTPTWNADRSQRTERRKLYDSAGNLVSVTDEVFQVYKWLDQSSGEELVRRVRDPDGAALVETWEYYADYAYGQNLGRYRRLRLHVEPSGRWEWFDYDTYGREIQRVFQHLGSASPGTGTPAASSHQAVVTTYSSSAPHRTRVESVLGTIVRKSWTIYISPSETQEIVVASPTAAYTDAANLVTVTKTYSVGEFSGRVRSIRRPDGTLETYAYAWQGNPAVLVTTKSVGAPNAANDAVTDGWKTVTTTNAAGQDFVVQTDDMLPGVTFPRVLRRWPTASAGRPPGPTRMAPPSRFPTAAAGSSRAPTATGSPPPTAMIGWRVGPPARPPMASSKAPCSTRPGAFWRAAASAPTNPPSRKKSISTTWPGAARRAPTPWGA